MSDLQKTLVIGLTGIVGVRSLSWGDLRSVPNLAVYQTIIIVEPSLTGTIETFKVESVNDPSEENIEAITERARNLAKDLSLLKGKLSQILRARGEIYGILSPYAYFVGSSRYASAINSYDWHPLPFSLLSEAWEQALVKDAAFEVYFSLADCGAHTLADRYSQNDLSHLVESDLDPKPRPELLMTPIATDWKGLALAAAFRFSLYRARTINAYEAEPFLVSGPFYVLPPPISSLKDAVVALLVEFCDLQPASAAPTWIQTIDVPGEGVVREAITAAKSRLVDAQSGLAHRTAELDALQKFKTVLYEKGLPLQAIVREIFDSMGLQTWDADKDVSDEFMVGDGVSELLVEVKGHRKSAQQADIRQLDESLDQHQTKFGTAVKGVLIVNAWCELPPSARDQTTTASFPDGVVRRARAIDTALLSCVSLFQGFCAFREGRVTGQQLFSSLVEGVGIVSLP